MYKREGCRSSGDRSNHCHETTGKIAHISDLQTPPPNCPSSTRLVQLALQCLDFGCQPLHLRGLIGNDLGLLSNQVLDGLNLFVNGADRHT